MELNIKLPDDTKYYMEITTALTLNELTVDLCSIIAYESMTYSSPNYAPTKTYEELLTGMLFNILCLADGLTIDLNKEFNDKLQSLISEYSRKE